MQAEAEILSRLHQLASTQDSQGEWQAIQRALSLKKRMPNRVLLVDDNASVRRSLCSLFLSDGFDVCGEAQDGEKAIEQAKRLQPDLIVLDLAMPIMNGLQAAKALKQIMPKVPIILFTLYVENALARRASEVGIASVISKHQDVTELLNEAHRLLREEGDLKKPQHP
jgi:DNA-binding NarL/FixJ family response regulator